MFILIGKGCLFGTIDIGDGLANILRVLGLIGTVGQSETFKKKMQVTLGSCLWRVLSGRRTIKETGIANGSEEYPVHMGAPLLKIGS